LQLSFSSVWSPKGVGGSKKMLQSRKVFILLACVLAFQEISGEISAGAQNAVDLPKCFSCEGVNCLRTTRQNATVSCSDKLDVCVTIYEDCKFKSVK